MQPGWGLIKTLVATRCGVYCAGKACLAQSSQARLITILAAEWWQVYSHSEDSEDFVLPA